MPYTSMQREFKEEIVSVKTIKDNNFHGGDRLHKDSPKYNIKINFNKNRKGGNYSFYFKLIEEDYGDVIRDYSN